MAEISISQIYKLICFFILATTRIFMPVPDDGFINMLKHAA